MVPLSHARKPTVANLGGNLDDTTEAGEGMGETREQKDVKAFVDVKVSGIT